MSFNWTPAAVEKLKQIIITKGQSYSVAAKELAELFNQPLTRNAAIGKAKRLGICDQAPVSLKRREQIARPKRKRIHKPRGFSFNKQTCNGVILAPSSVELPPDQSDCAVPLISAGDGQCRWPLGEPTHQMLVCGASSGDATYCQRHQRIAYRPYSTRESNLTNPKGMIWNNPRVPAVNLSETAE